MNEAYLRELVCQTSHQLWLRGLVAGEGGLVSVEVHRRRYLVTPPGARRAALSPEQVMCVDMGGQSIQDEASVEEAAWRPHRLAYQASLERGLETGDDRQAVGASILATPPGVLAAVRCGLGEALSVASVAGDDEAALRAALAAHRAIALSGLGLLSLGATLAEAHNRVEQLELAAAIELAAAGHAVGK